MKPKTRSQASPCAIVVTGTPGTGKTTVSRILAKEIGASYLSVRRLVANKRLHVGVDRRRQTRILDLQKTRALVMKMLSRRKSRTVVDTHVPDVVPRRYVSNVIVLRCHPRILQRRLRKKGWKPSKVRENVLAEILDSCYGLAIDYYGAKKVAQVDTSRIDADKSASRANRILKKRISSKPSVDWITRLSQEHRLEEFLR